MKKTWVRTVAILSVLTLLATALAGCGSQQAGARKVQIGVLADLTGGTADVGTPYFNGEKGFVEWINGKGGVGGTAIDYKYVDYSYKPEKAVEAYTQLIKQDKRVAMLGWGTGDTNALAEFIGEDQVPFLSASYDENLVRDVNTNPYNFVAAATYSDQGRIAIQWIKDNFKGSGAPKVALLYNSSPFGKAPMDDIKAYAKQAGVEVVADEIVELNAVDATSQLLNVQKAGAEFGIIQETTNATVTILKDAQKLGLKTQFIGLNWAFDENVARNAGPAAEGYMGMVNFAFPGDDVPGMKDIEAYLKSQSKTFADITQKFVAGWTTAMIMGEGIRLAGSDLSGAGIRKGLETMTDFDPAGLGAAVTFTGASHHGVKQARIYQIKDGKFVAMTDWIGYKE